MTQQVINESIALQWCQHQRHLLIRVLASFYQQYAGYRLPVSLTPGQAQQLAHDLKSSAPGCGATALALLAHQLAPPAMPPDALEQQALLVSLAEVLRAIEKDYPAAIAHLQNQQKDRLEELRQTLEQHNLRALTLFKDWAAEYAQDWPERVVNEIQQALNSFDFKRTQSLLEAAVLDAQASNRSDI